jgi:hypothetical protein
MRTLLICHDDAPLDREGLARWLASFSEYTGTIVLREPRRRLRRRIRREVARVGPWRFLDVLAYRILYRITRASRERDWEQHALEDLRYRFPGCPQSPELIVASPNSEEARRFLRERRPDVVIARCKTLLKESVFCIPTLGCYAMHPGICPEYRNAHGCFWALANGDDGNVGMTLLRIDSGVDTGPVFVFGYFRVSSDPSLESHVVAQHRSVLEHLDAIRDTFVEIESGRATPLDVSGRRSAAWGHPWLTAYMRMRWKNRGRKHELGISSKSDVRRLPNSNVSDETRQTCNF